MNFPITIEDKEQLELLFRESTRHTVKDTVETTVEQMLMELGLVKSVLTLKECENLSSEAMVRNGRKARQLNFVAKGKYWIIDRVEFKNWLKIHTYL